MFLTYFLASLIGIILKVILVFGIGYKDNIKNDKEILEKSLKVDKRLLKNDTNWFSISMLGAFNVDFKV
jgi:uncharacterized membrane protein YdjX (TVP38/TMEM64 family)